MGNDTQAFRRLFYAIMNVNLWLDIHVDHQRVHVDQKGVSLYAVYFWVLIWQYYTVII